MLKSHYPNQISFKEAMMGSLLIQFIISFKVSDYGTSCKGANWAFSVFLICPGRSWALCLGSLKYAESKDESMLAAMQSFRKAANMVLKILIRYAISVQCRHNISRSLSILSHLPVHKETHNRTFVDSQKKSRETQPPWMIRAHMPLALKISKLYCRTKDHTHDRNLPLSRTYGLYFDFIKWGKFNL